jgi:hypothetical protein
MRWWRDLLCSRPTRWVGFFLVLAHRNNSPRRDMSPTSLCSYSLMLHALRRRNKFQFYSFWFDTAWVQTNDQLHSNHYTTDAYRQTSVIFITWFTSLQFECLNLEIIYLSIFFFSFNYPIESLMSKTFKKKMEIDNSKKIINKNVHL